MSTVIHSAEDALARARRIDPDAERFVVRLFDGFDHAWIDVSEELLPEQAMAVWNQKTDGGSRATAFDDIDYYAIFPSTVKMVFGG